jgi:hypothetical protein
MPFNSTSLIPSTQLSDSLGDSLEDAFPDQEIGDEFAQESPIWTTISKQASNRDSDRIEVWDKTLDVHLVFVGTYSPPDAILTVIGWSVLCGRYRLPR